MTFEQWNWMAQWCRQRGYNPCDTRYWQLAENAHGEFVKNQDQLSNPHTIVVETTQGTFTK